MKPDRTSRALVCLLSAHALWLTCCYAEGAAYTSPGNSLPSKKNRLLLTVDFDDAGGYGRLPVRATFKAAKALQRDRLITFRLFTSSTFSRHDGFYELAVEQDVDLPAGATSVSLDLKAPKINDWNSVWWEVWIDGRRDDELLGSAPWQGGYRGERTARVLRSDKVKGPQAVSFEELAREHAGDAPPLVAETEQYQAAPMEYSVTFSYQQLPAEWQDYTCYDAVAAPLDELQALPANVLDGLKQWVLAGGMLIVEQAGEDFSRVGEIDSLLSRESELLATQTDLPAAVAPAGETVGPLSRETEFAMPDSDHWRRAAVWLPRDPASPVNDFSRRRRGGRRSPRVRPAWFAESQHGFGFVAAFPEGLLDLPEAPSRARGYSFGLAHYLDRRGWANRHGSTPNSGCEEFSNWLVPGVGAAPVDAFRWLITLFVLLVGPVCYFWLRAVQRTHLLALTAPAAALGFTVCLYAYATLGDGFGTRCRVRSVTLLDQTAGRATSWSRQTYYSGLAPAEGLLFPRSSVVYPLLPGWRETFLASRHNASRDVVVQDHTQQLAAGWLRSRETSQLLVVDSQPTEQSISISEEGEGLVARNGFSAPIEGIFVLDKDGNWWSGAALAPGERAELKPVDANDVTAALRAVVLDGQPEYPPGMEEGNEFTRRSRRYAQLNYSQVDFDLSSLGYGPTRFSESRLEAALGAVGGSDSGRLLPLRRNCFVAISRRAVMAPIGVPGAAEEDSLHVTLGRWAP
ncbi:MAG: hypothetical protein KDA37_04520 [Planctomycetales bacterium]|nr:hypothetical protein [Planctomycetales bacterium]